MTVPETSGERRFVRPADYYASATPDPVLPSWAAYGCGAAAVVVLIVVFAGGAWLARGGFTVLMDFAIGMSVAEMKGMYAPDVTPTQKDALDKEVEAMRTQLREEKISIPSLQPFLEAIRKTTKDTKVSGEEMKVLLDAATRARSSDQSKRR